MARDVVHTEEVVDAALAVLRGADGYLHTGGLPKAWFRDFDGEGVDDATFAQTTYPGAEFTVQIVAGETIHPNTFEWKKASGAFSEAAAIVAGATVSLGGEATVTFGSATGHKAGDTWYSRTTEVPLTLLDHGDLSDIPVEGMESLCPGIMVRGLGPRNSSPGGQGGVEDTEEIVRMVHLRRRDQCRDANGNLEDNMSLARERYAKVIGAALLGDPFARLGVEDVEGAVAFPSLTCSDAGGAQIVGVTWQRWDLGTDGSGAIPDVQFFRHTDSAIWAIACDLAVHIRIGGS
jgi:hypothetical protein